uniref:Uncharacterized protein n=1 Tax=Anguilla anguilla TaxID=7936 RepID=A0A0E9RHJ8_ANGAN
MVLFTENCRKDTQDLVCVGLRMLKMSAPQCQEWGFFPSLALFEQVLSLCPVWE